MMTRYVVFMGLVAGALLLPGSGCGGAKSCEDVCAAREACPDIVAGDKSCELQCKDEEALVKLAACEDQQQTWYECLSTVTDQCTEQTNTCGTEGKLRYACFNKYCSANPNVSGCSAYAGNP